jgi:hypothetical protein
MSEPGTAGASQAAELHASLLTGMHAMAQPLTLLRSHFYLAELSTTGAPSEQQLGVDAAAAVDHLCTVFRLMQELVHVQSVQARVVVTPLSRVIGLLAEDAEIVFAGSGLRLDMRRDGHAAGVGESLEPIDEGGLPGVSIDLTRTRQAIASMLHIVRECANSVVSCTLSAGDGWVELCLRPDASGCGQESFDDASRLHLALARASMQGQQAALALVAEPLALSIRMPVAEPAA